MSPRCLLSLKPSKCSQTNPKQVLPSRLPDAPQMIPPSISLPCFFELVCKETLFGISRWGHECCVNPIIHIGGRLQVDPSQGHVFICKLLPDNVEVQGKSQMASNIAVAWYCTQNHMGGGRGWDDRGCQMPYQNSHKTPLPLYAVIQQWRPCRNLTPHWQGRCTKCSSIMRLV
jgi:hypothetical protein